MSGRLVLRAALAMGVFWLLVAAWPLLETHYGYLFRASGNAALSVLDAGRYRLKVVSAPRTDEIDTIVRAEHVARHERWGAALRSRTVGYLPLAVFLSLLAATPITARRRLPALLIGIALLQIYTLARFALLLAYALTLHAQECTYPHAGFLFEGWWQQVIHYLLLALHREVMIPFVVPVLVWVLVCFRNEDGGIGTARESRRVPRWLPIA